MSAQNTVLATNDDFPIRTDKPVHSGKVRSVYWLSDADSQRLIAEKGYKINSDTPLAIMIISDRISAFECLWHGKGDVHGIPGKGAALNAIAAYWFKLFDEQGIAGHHIVDIPHPLVWIVQKARPVMIEAIARNYITGSMWRDYAKGVRNFCGIAIPENLTKDSKLTELLMTPSTKGILTGIEGVPEQDDVNISRAIIKKNYEAFKFNSVADVDVYEEMLSKGFELISTKLAELDQIFVDTKFEFGYITDANGKDQLICIDEVGTPDSSRIWDGAEYRSGKIVENSKEVFRKLLLNHFESDILTNKERMEERYALAKDSALPIEMLNTVSEVYLSIAEKITCEKITLSDNPREEIIAVLKDGYGLIY